MAERQAQRGFTLLEVMVALVIVALGLMAAFGQVNQSLTVASRLRDKTLANWVALNQMTELRLLGQSGEFPAIGSRSDEVDMARNTWRFTVKVVKTPLATMRRVDISVAFADRPDTVVTTLTGFLGKPPAKAPTTTKPSEWVPLESSGK
jgi:general secretion pathway protein I